MDDFARWLRLILGGPSRLSKEWSNRPRLVVDGDDGPWRESWATLREGMVGEFAFMRVDIVGHSRIARENPSSTVEIVLEHLERHVETVVDSCRGRIWNWAGDGGLIAFHEGTQTEKVADAMTAAWRLLNSLEEFNDRYPLEQKDDEIVLRIAIHGGTARYRSHTGRVHSSAINFVAHLEHDRTHPNSISISEQVYRELPRKERARFVAAGTFEGLPIYTSDTVNKGNFPRRSGVWDGIATALATLAMKLQEFSEDAVLVSFYYRSAIAAGMLAHNLGLKPVIVLGRDKIRDDYETYVRLTEQFVRRGRIIIVSFAIDSVDNVASACDFLVSRGVKDVVVATIYITPNALLRLRGLGVEIVFGEERELGSGFYDELPWNVPVTPRTA